MRKTKMLAYCYDVANADVGCGMHHAREGCATNSHRHCVMNTGVVRGGMAVIGLQKEWMAGHLVYIAFWSSLWASRTLSTNEGTTQVAK